MGLPLISQVGLGNEILIMKLSKIFNDDKGNRAFKKRDFLKLFFGKYTPDAIDEITPARLAQHFMYSARRSKTTDLIQEFQSSGHDLSQIMHGATAVNFLEDLRTFLMAGVISHPNEGPIKVSYEKSGLYKWTGKQPDVGGAMQANVLKSGWYLRAGERLLPIIHAVVKSLECVGED